MSEHFIEVEHLRQYFPAAGGQHVRAVEDLTFYIDRGETLGLVGESGCGKTTAARAMLRLYEPTGGRFTFDGNVLFDVEKREYADMKPCRKRMQLVFQDPYGSLNPRMTVGDIVGEAIDVHKLAVNKRDRQEQVAQQLERVGLRPEHMERYPHEFSGGQRQRVGIARALAVQPEFLICDEPVSALDVTVQAQIMELFQELQEKLGLTYLFISHDLEAVRQISDRIAVMHQGRIVEISDRC